MEAKKPGFLAVQKMVFEVLSTKFQNIPVLDNVEENQPFPYITIGEDDFDDVDNKTHHSDEATVTVEVWSRARGFAEVKNTMTDIIEALSGSDISQQEGYYIQYLNVVQMETSRESDGITRSGMVRIKFRVNQGD